MIRAKAHVDWHRAPPNDMDWELVRWFLQGNQGLVSKERGCGLVGGDSFLEAEIVDV